MGINHTYFKKSVDFGHFVISILRTFAKITEPEVINFLAAILQVVSLFLGCGWRLDKMGTILF